ncbi:hypothetical protein THSYN_20620 [Candidatus Thiodictyon syntrophicum]|uniref:Uncharacterized protein n=1 Tax=Candidatus Thiodictyon syntrophicum TaxID=1166950 RepID=A0A2K8UDE5_9GAMM|nr:hypothetical protein THSYN_20620 [Candidatus Thiodictyon syntrophicum]
MAVLDVVDDLIYMAAIGLNRVAKLTSLLDCIFFAVPPCDVVNDALARFDMLCNRIKYMVDSES